MILKVSNGIYGVKANQYVRLLLKDDDSSGLLCNRESENSIREKIEKLNM